MDPERSRSQYLHYCLQCPPHPYMFCLSLPMLSTWPWSSEPPPPYNPSPHPPFSTPVQLECSSTVPLSRSTSWKPGPYQTQYNVDGILNENGSITKEVEVIL